MEMPRVTSAEVARQEGQVLEGQGAMGAAQMQQRIVGRVPVGGGALAISIVWSFSLVLGWVICKL